ncbi:MAG: hypothetical protein WC494_02460 [Candidatus Pacearchaeota archaeon]
MSKRKSNGFGVGKEVYHEERTDSAGGCPACPCSDWGVCGNTCSEQLWMGYGFLGFSSSP